MPLHSKKIFATEQKGIIDGISRIVELVPESGFDPTTLGTSVRSAASCAIPADLIKIAQISNLTCGEIYLCHNKVLGNIQANYK